MLYSGLAFIVQEAVLASDIPCKLLVKGDTSLTFGPESVEEIQNFSD